MSRPKGGTRTRGKRRNRSAQKEKNGMIGFGKNKVLKKIKKIAKKVLTFEIRVDIINEL